MQIRNDSYNSQHFGQLVLRKSGKSKTIGSIDVWQSAFRTFTSIFLSRHPSRCAELLKYAEIIRLAAIQFPGFGWRVYDQQFRLKQELNPMRAWGVIDIELWLTVTAAGVTAPESLRSNSQTTVQSYKYKGDC